MKKSLIVIIAIIGILVVGGIWASGAYNGMVQQEEAVSSQWAQVQNAYQRRADLIPNLVNTVKGYASHEQETFKAVTEARASATQFKLDPDQLTPENLKKYQEVQGSVGSALSRLMMVQENYPELKANTNFLALQDELAGTENRISTERNRFNELVKVYNAHIRSFPKNILAGLFGFTQKAYFEATQEAQTAPKVEF